MEDRGRFQAALLKFQKFQILFKLCFWMDIRFIGRNEPSVGDKLIRYSLILLKPYLKSETIDSIWLQENQFCSAGGIKIYQ